MTNYEIFLRKGPKYREPVSFSWHQNFGHYHGFMRSVRQTVGEERGCRTRHSFWVDIVDRVMCLNAGIRRLKHSINTRHESILVTLMLSPELSRLHENFVIVPADKASNNYTFVCKRYYVDILIEELGLHLLPGNPTYNLTNFSASEVLDNHKSVLNFLRNTNNRWRARFAIHFTGFQRCTKTPYKHRFIAGSSKCSTKPLSILLTKLLTYIKQGLQKYCETSYSRSGVNQMWILKNSIRIIRTSSISKFQPYHKHLVLWFFDPLHNHSSPKT